MTLAVIQNLTILGYNILVDMFKGSTIPVFFSEYGCNEVQPRVFNEVEALYGKEMTSLSGGLVYEYSQEEADYGLVQINDDNITLRTDYVCISVCNHPFRY